MTAGTPPMTPATATGPSDKQGGGFSWAALFFLGPAGLLLIVFLAYPTLYTLALSFNRGRNGQFSNWVGLDNWIRLFTQDPNFLKLGFPP
ncbi:MAG: sugar ABC transporter permease, partial [Chloroflexi bacterium]|nr:sugar ABC transporter permease [Chloroflexota bacterium]